MMSEAKGLIQASIVRLSVSAFRLFYGQVFLCGLDGGPVRDRVGRCASRKISLAQMLVERIVDRAQSSLTGARRDRGISR